MNLWEKLHPNVIIFPNNNKYNIFVVNLTSKLSLVIFLLASLIRELAACGAELEAEVDAECGGNIIPEDEGGADIICCCCCCCCLCCCCCCCCCSCCWCRCCCCAAAAFMIIFCWCWAAAAAWAALLAVALLVRLPPAAAMAIMALSMADWPPAPRWCPVGGRFMWAGGRRPGADACRIWPCIMEALAALAAAEGPPARHLEWASVGAEAEAVSSSSSSSPMWTSRTGAGVGGW